MKITICYRNTLCVWWRVTPQTSVSVNRLLFQSLNNSEFKNTPAPKGIADAPAPSVHQQLGVVLAPSLPPVLTQPLPAWLLQAKLWKVKFPLCIQHVQNGTTDFSPPQSLLLTQVCPSQLYHHHSPSCLDKEPKNLPWRLSCPHPTFNPSGSRASSTFTAANHIHYYPSKPPFLTSLLLPLPQKSRFSTEQSF